MPMELTPEQQENEMWFIQRLGLDGGPPKGGLVVKTKTGKTGHTKHSDDLVNGKVPVYLDDGGKMLCTPNTLTHVGYWD